MSQAAPAPAMQSSLPQSFLKTPANFHTGKVPEGTNSASDSPSVPPAVPPITSLAPKPLSESTNVPPAAPVDSPSSVQFTPLPQQTFDPSYVQQVIADRDRLAQNYEQMRKELENYAQSQRELDEIKRQQALQQAISPELYDKLESIDKADAEALTQAVLTAARAPIESLKSELENQRALVAAQAKSVAREQQRQRIERLNAEVRRYHPDFDALQNTKEYHEFMSQHDGLSSKTRDERAAEEFLAGNTAYVVDLLNQLKGNKSQVQNITTVAPVQSASAVAVAPAAAPQITLRDLNNMYQMRQISHDQYRAELQKLRAAGAIG